MHPTSSCVRIAGFCSGLPSHHHVVLQKPLGQCKKNQQVAEKKLSKRKNSSKIVKRYKALVDLHCVGWANFKTMGRLDLKCGLGAATSLRV